jgi:predicted DNA-binding transcriptional regulator YafY
VLFNRELIQTKRFDRYVKTTPAESPFPSVFRAHPACSSCILRSPRVCSAAAAVPAQVDPKALRAQHLQRLALYHRILMDRTERFYKIDRLLVQHRCVPIARFLEELEVSPATFKRDIEYMRNRLHAPIVWDREQNGYCLTAPAKGAPPYQLPGLWFNASEIHALLAMERLVEGIDPGILAQRLNPLRQRLRELLGSADHSAEEVRRRIKVLPMAGRTTPAREFETAANALLNRKRLFIRYLSRSADVRHAIATAALAPPRDDKQGHGADVRHEIATAHLPAPRDDSFPSSPALLPGGEARQANPDDNFPSSLAPDPSPKGRGEITEREISPQRLVHYRENWYLDAWCHMRNALRTFSMDRVQAAEICATRAMDVPEAELDEVLGSGYGIFAGRDVTWAKLRFSPAAARWVAAESWHPKQRGSYEADGSYILEIPYSDDRELVRDILRHGADVEVVTPASLREAVRAELVSALKRY